MNGWLYFLRGIYLFSLFHVKTLLSSVLLEAGVSLSPFPYTT